MIKEPVYEAEYRNSRFNREVEQDLPATEGTIDQV